jgi:hypothetical protein
VVTVVSNAPGNSVAGTTVSGALLDQMPTTIPIKVSRIGRMPQKRSTLRSKLLRLCAPKYQR